MVNVGDALRFLSERVFRSCLHRVVPHRASEGEFRDGKGEGRYSIAYFLRPGVETVFKDAEGVVRTSAEWHQRKFESFQSKEAGKLGGILGGRD